MIKKNNIIQNKHPSWILKKKTKNWFLNCDFDFPDFYLCTIDWNADRIVWRQLTLWRQPILTCKTCGVKLLIVGLKQGPTLFLGIQSSHLLVVLQLGCVRTSLHLSLIKRSSLAIWLALSRVSGFLCIVPNGSTALIASINTR